MLNPKKKLRLKKQVLDKWTAVMHQHKDEQLFMSKLPLPKLPFLTVNCIALKAVYSKGNQPIAFSLPNRYKIGYKA